MPKGLASGFPEDTNALPIRARARVLGAMLRKNESIEYLLSLNRLSYLVAARGRLAINGVRLDQRDGAAVWAEAAIVITSLEDAEILFVDVRA